MGIFGKLFSTPEAADGESVAAGAPHFSCYEDYKSAHRVLVLIDRHRDKFTWHWENPVVVTVEERLDQETVRRFQLFIAQLKQHSPEEYFLTGYSFASQTERSLFLFESNPDAASIRYCGQTFTPGNLFNFLKGKIFAPNQPPET